MEEALHDRLIADAAVGPLIGDRAAWGERIEAESLPALVLNRVTAGRDYDHDGNDGLQTPIIQIDCLGSSYIAARALACKVIDAVEPAATEGGIEFGQSFLQADRDMDPVDLPGGERAFRVSLDFLIFYKEL